MTARRVLEEDRLGRRIAAGAHVAAYGWRRSLASRRVWRHARRSEAPSARRENAEHGVDDPEGAVLLGRAEDPVQALVEREAGARDEDPDRGEEGPEEALLAVAEGVLGVGRALAERQREEQEDLVHRVGDRVGGLGEHGRGARDEAGGGLGHRDRGVGAQRDEDGAARGAGPPLPAISASRCARRRPRPRGRR